MAFAVDARCNISLMPPGFCHVVSQGAVCGRRAACHLKLSKSSEAAADCSEVLERDPRNVKALFRLGQALVGLKDYEEAIKQLKQAAELEPNDKGIACEVTCWDLMPATDADEEACMHMQS